MIRTRFLFLISFIGLLILVACNEKNKSTSQTHELVRFENLLMQIDTQNIDQAVEELELQYPVFVPLYFQEVLPLPGYSSKSDTFYQSLKGFISDPGINEIYSMVRQEFGDFDALIEQITAAMNDASTWFPESEAPRIYTYLSEFGYQQFLFEDIDKEGLAIGLDLFLDDVFDYSVLESGTNAFSQYLTRTYDSQHLVRKVLDSWVEDKMGLVRGDRLIDHMIFNGTKLYILDNLLNIPDSILLEQPNEKVEWLRDNEKPMWSFYFENNWFYTTDQYVIKRLVEPAPNSVALKMPSAAPGQTGNYLGWRIVQNYMKRFPESTVNEILNSDAQKVLESSRFKPGGGGR